MKVYGAIFILVGLVVTAVFLQIDPTNRYGGLPGGLIVVSGIIFIFADMANSPR